MIAKLIQQQLQKQQWQQGQQQQLHKHWEHLLQLELHFINPKTIIVKYHQVSRAKRNPIAGSANTIEGLYASIDGREDVDADENEDAEENEDKAVFLQSALMSALNVRIQRKQMESRSITGDIP